MRPAPQQAPPSPFQPNAEIRRDRRVRIRLVLIAISIVALAAAGTAWWKTTADPNIQYITSPVTRGDIAHTVAATGTVNPELTVIVGSYVSGVIQKLLCDYNTQVKAGQVCAKIDPRPYQTVVDQSEAELGIARAQLDKDKATLAYAKLNRDRTSKLAAKQYGSQDVADNAKSLYDQAVAQVGLDQATITHRLAEVDAAQVNLGYTDIISPVDGTVVSRNVTQGQTVAASFQTPTLFLIATDLTKMQVDTNVSESDIGGVKEGDKASFTVDAFLGRVFEGTVKQVRQSPQTVQNVVTFDAVIGIGNQDLALKPGMTASVRIVTGQRNNVSRVPNQALRYLPSGAAGKSASRTLPTEAGPGPEGGAASKARLWVLKDGKPVPRDVATGLQDDSYTEIVSGDIKPGDAVIVGEGSASPDGSFPGAAQR